jgi:tartrate dehydrogenase/decarboxylase/D-malate dehydrogenase
MVKKYNIATIPGDGIGNEVITAGIEVIDALSRQSGEFQYAIESFNWGSERYKKHGALMPDDSVEQLKVFDVILFGAVGAPDVPINLWV